MHTKLVVLLAGFVLSLAATVPAQVLRAAPEFQVNQYTTGFQRRAGVAAGAAGSFMMVWSSPQDGDGYGIMGRRFDANGMALSGEFVVNTYTTSGQFVPHIGSDAAGNFVVVWNTNNDATSGSIAARRYDSSGVPLGTEFQVNNYTTGSQSTPSVGVDGSGNFVVAWQSDAQDGDSSGVFARRFDSSGTPLTGDFQVNQYTTGTQWNPGVGMDASGNFVIAWTGSGGQDGDSDGIFARRYDNTGAPLGPEFQVNSYTTGSQYFGFVPSLVASDAAGKFVISWTDQSGQDGNGRGAFARQFGADGVPLGAEFQVNALTTGPQYPTAVGADPSGNFVITWIDIPGTDGSAGSGGARRFSSTGAPLTDDFQINEWTTGFQFSTGILYDAAGNIVFASESDGQDGAGRAVIAQRFAAPRVLLGKKLLVKDPNGTESLRGTIGLAKETASDIGPLAGDPVTNGATLRVVVNGAVPSDQTYALDAGGWSALGTTGFKYIGPTGADGDPVKKVLLKLSPSGTALMKVLLKGNVGTQLLNLLPPNPGVGGELILSVRGGGATYCTTFGGAAGGNVITDSATIFKMINPAGQDCPEP